MTTEKIIRLSASPEGFGQTPDSLDTEMFISALPLQHTHTYYHDEELGLYVGVWDTTDMIETAGPSPCDEFMWLLEGEAQIRNCQTEKTETAKAGEAFVIPKGYDCQWRQTGYLRKFFLISENPDEPVPEKPVVEGIIIPRADAALTPADPAEPFLADAGNPVQQQNICYRNCSGNFQAGTWESGSFESKARPFPRHQLACVISGSLTLLDESGNEHLYNPGDAFFIPQGVICGARVTDTVRLFFANIEPAQAGNE